MNLDPLPPGLRELEELLSRRPCPKPAADLRGRLLGRLANQGARPRVAAAGLQRLWPVAAAVVFALNLWLCVSNGARYQSVTALAQANSPVPRRLPEAGDVNDRFEVLAANTLAQLALAPDVGVPGRLIFTTKEDYEWALP